MRMGVGRLHIKESPSPSRCVAVFSGRRQHGVVLPGTAADHRPPRPPASVSDRMTVTDTIGLLTTRLLTNHHPPSQKMTMAGRQHSALQHSLASHPATTASVEIAAPPHSALKICPRSPQTLLPWPQPAAPPPPPWPPPPLAALPTAAWSASVAPPPTGCCAASTPLLHAAVAPPVPPAPPPAAAGATSPPSEPRAGLRRAAAPRWPLPQAAAPEPCVHK